jgi:hypothetical protein
MAIAPLSFSKKEWNQKPFQDNSIVEELSSDDSVSVSPTTGKHG